MLLALVDRRRMPYGMDSVDPKTTKLNFRLLSVFILLRSNQKCKYIHDTNRIDQTYVHTNSFPFICLLKFI